MKIEKLSLSQLNEFFTKDPKLCYQGLTDESMDYLYHRGTVVVTEGAEAYGIFDDEDTLFCCLELEPWNKICAMAHLYLASNYQGKGMAKQLKQYFIDFTKEQLTYKKILFYVPGSCQHVIRTVQAIECKHEACIEQCIIWRMKPDDLHIYSLTIE